MSIQIKKAEMNDIETLTVLLHELYNDDGLYGENPYDELFASNEDDLADKKMAFFLAYENDLPVGAAHISLREEYVNGKESDGACGYLEAIYVRPVHRKRGVAKMLVEVCENYVKQCGCHEFLSDCLLDNHDSYNFHCRLGFIETERVIMFRKELN
jgi:aminoglycoside 6'-N-acetyltransferase I